MQILGPTPEYCIRNWFPALGVLTGLANEILKQLKFGDPLILDFPLCFSEELFPKTVFVNKLFPFAVFYPASLK